MDENQKLILEYLDRPGAWFDHAWVADAHRLLMLLLNIPSRDDEEEWRCFMKLFEAGAKSRSLDLAAYPWPRCKTDPAMAEWKICRDMTRRMVRARHVDWLKIVKEYPPELVERAARGMYEKLDRHEIYDPMDMIWIAWTYGLVYEIAYRPCATPGCERFTPVSFPKPAVGHPPCYCASCKAANREVNKHRDLTRHLDRKKKLNEECWEIVRRALEKIPAKERRIASDKDRRVLAKRLFKVVSRKLAKAPGKRGMRWIAKRLKPKGSNNEQNQGRPKESAGHF